MTVDASIPKALYQANIELALRIAALLQENGKQWFDLFAEEASTRFDEGVSSLAALGSGASLEKLAALPADTATQLLQLDVGRWQAVISHAVENQTLFSDGLQDALRQWQGACSEAFDVTGAATLPNLSGALASLPGFSDVAMSFQRFMTQAVPSVGAVYSASVGTPGSKAPRPAPAAAQPASKPAAKSSSKKPTGKPASTSVASGSAREQGKAAESSIRPASTSTSSASKTRAPAKTARKAAAKPAPKPVEKTAIKTATKAATKLAAPARKAASKTKSTPVPPPSPMPALVTTPRKAAKRAPAKAD